MLRNFCYGVLIINRLKKFSASKNQLRKYLNQLIILSRLRNLDINTINTINEMPVTIDIEKDFFFKKGIEKGREQWIQETLSVLQYHKEGKTLTEITQLTKIPKEDILRILEKI